MALELKTVVVAGRPRVFLSGDIIEGSRFEALSAQLPAGAALDVSGVRRINSYGVMRWMEFVQGRAEAGVPFVLERCSPAFVAQLNMVAGFDGGMPVGSVLTPYFCATCDEEQLADLELTGSQAVTVAASLPCPRCGESMEFDDLTDTYLAFDLRRRMGAVQ